MSVSVDAIRAVPLLAGLSDKDLKSLAGTMRERTYQPGEKIVEEGAGGVGFFVILEGTAEVSMRGARRGEMRAGDHFGELGLLDDAQGRQATVTAVDSTRCGALTSWQFRPFLREHPDVAWSLMQGMAQRIAANERHHDGNAAVA